MADRGGGEGAGRGPEGEFLTSEQREFARIEQERLDAELARELAAAEGAAGGDAGAHRPAGGDDGGGWGTWGGDSLWGAPAGYEQLPAGRDPSPVQLPLMQNFFCCISLRCGVLTVAACDAVAAIFQVRLPVLAPLRAYAPALIRLCAHTPLHPAPPLIPLRCAVDRAPQTLAALLVMTMPELALEDEDETLLVGGDMQARARRFLEREMRARLFLSIMMAFFAIRGFKSVQSVDVQGRQAPASVCMCVRACMRMRACTFSRQAMNACS